MVGTALNADEEAQFTAVLHSRSLFHLSSNRRRQSACNSCLVSMASWATVGKDVPPFWALQA